MRSIGMLKPARLRAARLRVIAVALVAGASLLAGAGLPAAASAGETAVLHTSFTPDRLGASTTIGFSFQLTNTEGGLPSPLRSVNLHLPPGIDYVTTTLGLAICHPESLIAKGLQGCSPNSRLGSGTAFVEVPFGDGAGHEIPDLQALMGPPHNGNIVVLFYANGQEPIFAQLVFPGELVPGTGSFGGGLNTAIPLIPSVTEGPPVSIISVHATIGPNHLIYYRHVHGKRVKFHPRGVSVPEHCPHGGFAFSADFSFQDGSSATASSTVPCPSHK